jgi:hypothetical protein
MADGRGPRRRRAALWCGGLLTVLMVLAGCAAPEYTYVTNSTDRTYLKIPTTWRPIDPKAIDAALGLDTTVKDSERGLWLVGYDADASPSPDHLFGATATAPATLVGVQDVPTTARGSYSLDKLRDLFYPVSPASQQQAAADPTSAVSDISVMSDEVLTPGKGVRGVHTVFSYRVAGGPPQVMDQTLYLNDDASKLYLFFVRCSTECYQQRQKEITSVVSSFTVKEKL